MSKVQIASDHEALVLEDGTTLEPDEWYFEHPDGRLRIKNVASFRGEEFDIFDTICKRMGMSGGAWKAFGLHGMSKTDVLFLAKLSGKVTEKELEKILQINKTLDEMVERAVKARLAKLTPSKEKVVE